MGETSALALMQASSSFGILAVAQLVRLAAAATPAPPGTGIGKSKATLAKTSFNLARTLRVGPMQDEATDSSRMLLAQW